MMRHCSSLTTFLLICLVVLLLSQSLIHSLSPSSQLCHPDESSALLQFRNSFSINIPIFFNEADLKTVSWKNGTDCCSWDGVLCDTFSGHVIGLNLSYSRLQGPLHSNSTLFSLRHIQTLILDYNDFYGSSIPPEFGSFLNMKRLSLYDANFTGYVPVEMSHLSKMTYLTLYSFSSSDNILLETSVLKRMLQNFTNLRELSLGYVNMSNVELASSFMNVSSSLKLLNLYYCGLQGKFPENVFRLPNLHQLYLWYNHDLIGSMPTFNWSSPLRYVDLSQTRISIDFSYLCASAKSLQSLYLKNCSFIGSSYSAMWTNLPQLVQLTSLDLSYNNFGGQIPLLSLNLQHFIYLDLSNNNFVGNIPEFSKTNSTQSPPQLSLQHLSLSHNLLSESIPSWIYSLPYLVYLGLDNNKLSGPILEFQSKSLEHFNLGSNKLQGQIPNSVFQQSNLKWLDLSNNNLDGVLELNKYSMLKNLLSLELSFNNFTVASNKYANSDPFPQLSHLGLASCNISHIPHILKSMKRLNTLQLSYNQIHGRIPEWLWNEGTSSLSVLNISYNFLKHVERIPFKNLAYLDLRSNMIQGPLPIVPPLLRILLISNNHLSGEIPSAYCNLSQLDIFDVSNNSIHGNIPSCFQNKFSLTVLDLHMNNFSGEIPHDMFEKLIDLRSLHLSDNHLEGSLPHSMLNCQSLEVLDVGNNKLNDTFPHWLQELPMLQVLVLKSNRFHGSIGAPKVKFPFHKLQIMDLSNNEFNGLLPAKYFESFTAMMDGHTSSNFTSIKQPYYQDSVIVVVKGFERLLEKIISIFVTIDFSRNNFDGEIPESIGKLKSLKGLNFSHNKLKGFIPMSLANLSNLEWLDLSVNGLIGEIPSKMVDLTQLSHLNLSYNKLKGSIPLGNQFHTFNNDSYDGNIELCGFPLSRSCNNGMQQDGDRGEKLTDHIIFDWKIVMIGYGCGLIIGISIGYMVLYTGRFDYWLYKKVGVGGQRQRICRKRNARLRRRR
ncbi:receptor-like protein 54 [Humulus lupulus]|uniref:receptor-like protein 54 n=1 Tax=Humulus lupulus TaxID=3486 RepID=UPI002B4031FD|nr:receptor-like protein 54 [Humulus lupulus]XP_062078779.1 receptor-like protein 54 [Humulus lupulus]XP_062078781.1 receptor-like protein 54 [Humulus lupulus]XP_062078782.1 receptor-like protein 54 [Humulus lupulus]